MPLFIVRDNIINMDTDAIVNTANRLPLVGSGIDKAIYEAAGWEELLAWRKSVGVIEVGHGAVSPAFRLRAKYIIHTVGPLWCGGMSGEEHALQKCYETILALATKYKCRSVAIPLISTGNFRFPKDLALEIANRVIAAYLETYDITVYLVVFDTESYHISKERFADVRSYIDARYVEETALCEYIEPPSAARYNDMDRRRSFAFSTCATAEIFSSKKASSSLAEAIDKLEDTFAEALLRHIDNKGFTDPEVYKRANLDRKLFSKIKKNKSYQPSKTTALAFAIALKLTLEETKDFIAKAGYALTHSSKADIIVEYFIKRKEYDIFKLNEVLFEFGEPLLGSKVA